jgi:predicted KAP-like P-loop ATPase
VIADIPALRPGLGFQQYADAIAAAIRGGDPPQFTVGIYGAWGSGKSSLLRAVLTHLESDPDVIPVSFDAWRYERVEHIVVPMLHEIQRVVSEGGDRELVKHLRRALVSVIFSLNFKLSGVTLDGSKVRDQWEKQGLPRLDSAFSEPFDALHRMSEALGRRRLVILIDDLDRCSPSKVVSVLEAINVVMDVHGLVFVLALDYDVLTAAVRQQYPHVIEPHVFIEKMVQLPFRVPPRSSSRRSGRWPRSWTSRASGSSATRGS